MTSAAQDPQAEYQAKWSEYQAVMHRGAWRIGWGLFAVLVGLLPLMWLFIWMVGPGNWEKTLFHAPMRMWPAVPLSLSLVVAVVLHLYHQRCCAPFSRPRRARGSGCLSRRRITHSA